VPRRVRVLQPVPGGVRGVDLVDQADRPVGVAAELVLGIDEDEPAFGCDFLAKLENLLTQNTTYVNLIAHTSTKNTKSTK
jgi:hypothetical protein